MAAEKYRKLFPYCEYNITEAVSYAVTACNLNFILRKEQMQALYEYTRGRDVNVNLQTGYTEKVFATLYVPFNDLHVTVYAVLLPKNREVRFTIHMFINGSQSMCLAFSHVTSDFSEISLSIRKSTSCYLFQKSSFYL